ncbi:MAG TPA: peptidase [Actinobacteria bacterium]|nr:peptidase [Actinomycetota bacterium]
MAGMPMPRVPLPRLALPALALAGAVAVAGCTSAGTAEPAGSPATSQTSGPAQASAVHWHACTVQGAPMRCASLQVPLDYSHPAGRKLTLALSEVPATAPPSRQQGDLLVNPGGPGGSGLALAAIVAQGLDHTVASEYNIIGFDPRGVGSSIPALHCDPSFFAGVRPDYIPANARAEQVLINRAKTYAADCQRRFGWLLPYMTTENVARDADAIRAALGQQQINYFAYSYGTYIGQVYATLFPHRVRRMVLDSTVDPRGVWYGDNISQDYAFEGRMLAFFTWVASHNDIYRLGSTRARVQQAWYGVRARLKAHPIAGPAGPMIGPDEFDDTFLQGGYTSTLWPGLATALAAYVHAGAPGMPTRAGAGRLVIAQYQEFGTQNENEFAVYNAVECADVNWPRNWAKWNADTRRVYRTAPFQAWDNAWFNASCAFWPVRGPARPLPIGSAGLPGILMIQGTLDAATPYPGAQAAERRLPTARMVVVAGGGNHGQSLAQPPNTCVDGYLNRYLATGALPSRPGLVDAVCPPGPAPAPGG